MINTKLIVHAQLVHAAINIIRFLLQTSKIFLGKIFKMIKWSFSAKIERTWRMLKKQQMGKCLLFYFVIALFPCILCFSSKQQKKSSQYIFVYISNWQKMRFEDYTKCLFEFPMFFSQRFHDFQIFKANIICFHFSIFQFLKVKFY